jgi:phenylpropionate dioxygenase-like ring-hydroxylating dioxygenase large terminal subunit
MLNERDNELLIHVGPGTPMGDYFRRFWLPFLASAEIRERDGAPRRLRLLGEDLVAFRDSDGRVGVLEAYCTHRRANLFFGRNEECGLRCAYHGWKFDVEGRCVDLPSEPATSSFREKVEIKSYPTVERGGFLWIHMGPAELRPEFPEYEWAAVGGEQRITGTHLCECNWLQALEGDVDTAHVSFLHRWLDPDTAPSPGQMVSGYRSYIARDTAPRLTVKETDYGFLYGGRRNVGSGRYYWRVTHWMAPTATLIPGSGSRAARILTPIDDGHALSATLLYNPDGPLAEAEKAGWFWGRLTAGDLALQPFRLRDGYVIDTWRPERTVDNDYLIDRGYQRSTKFSGIAGSPADEDRAITETMERPTIDRTREHLGTTDVAIIALRRRLLREVRQLQHGVEPPLARNGRAFAVRGFDVVSPQEDFNQLIRELASELAAPATAGR